MPQLMTTNLSAPAASSGPDAGLYALDALAASPELLHGLSTRHRPPGPWGPAGDWNMKRRGADPAQAAANWAAFVACAGVPLAQMVAPQQIHGVEVVAVSQADAGKGMQPGDPGLVGADALVTNTRGLYLLTGCADCAPIFLYDPQQGAVGLAHAGWRGTAGRIAEKTVQAMTQAYGTDPATCVAVIGPSIGPCCYNVGQEVIDAIRDAYPEADDEWHGEPSLLIWSRRQPQWQAQRGDPPDGEERVYLDLWGANRRALLLAGLQPAHIHTTALCTADHVDLFYSHRAEEGQAGRFMAILGLRET
jgi:YfiH family protein